jgi:hypothetical protein
MPEPLLIREVKCVDWNWLPAKSLNGSAEHAPVLYVRNSNGRISPLINIATSALGCECHTSLLVQTTITNSTRATITQRMPVRE